MEKQQKFFQILDTLNAEEKIKSGKTFANQEIKEALVIGKTIRGSQFIYDQEVVGEGDFFEAVNGLFNHISDNNNISTTIDINQFVQMINTDNTDGSDDERIKAKPGSNKFRVANNNGTIVEGSPSGNSGDPGFRILQIAWAVKNLLGDNNFVEFQKYGVIYPCNSSNLEKEYETNTKTTICDLIQHGGCRQIILTGAPGTGKTHFAKEIAKELGEEIGIDNDSKSKKYELVQFHPSYDYTDFVEGLRPITIENNGKEEITFAKLDGVFKAFCRAVVKKNNSPTNQEGSGDVNQNAVEQVSSGGENVKSENELPLYFFIIDEINRANLSKVFGELMFGLERDKRGVENAFKTQYSNLPTYDVDENGKWDTLSNDVFADGFYIPENVVIIGTMNDIDRSVDSMDFALRRRFEWKEIMVSKELLVEAFEFGKFGKICKWKREDISDRIIKLNTLIAGPEGQKYGLNRHYNISQGQFANLSFARDAKIEIDDAGEIDDASEKNAKIYKGFLEYVWDYRIESLLREYLRGEEDVDSFITQAHNAFFDENTKKTDDIAQSTLGEQKNGETASGNDNEQDN